MKRAALILGSIIGLGASCALLFAGAYAAVWGFMYSTLHSESSRFTYAGILAAILAIWAAFSILTRAVRGLRRALDPNGESNRDNPDDQDLDMQ